MLVDHRRYRGIPDQRGVTGVAKRRARRRDRAAMNRHEGPVRPTVTKAPVVLQVETAAVDPFT